MAHDSNGRIYVDTQNDIGIGIQEVNTVLGAGSLYLATLCLSPRVNTYAKCKPCGGTYVGALSLAQRQALNCGIDCSDSSTGCFSADLTALLARAKALFDWQKVTPTVCRLLDFDGYEHNASAPYVALPDIIGNTTGDRTMNVTIVPQQVIESGNVQISDLVEALTRKGNVTGDFRRGLLVRNTSDPSNPAEIAKTAGSSQYVFTAPADYAHPVTYDCVFVHYAQNGNTYWAVFYPRTYFQAKMALFYVSSENQTLSFPKAGGEVELTISGYNWQASWGGKDNPDADLVMSLSPGQGGTVSPWSSVVLYVAPTNYENETGVVSKKITIAAPGQVGTGPDFTKEFYVQQACNVRPPSSRFIIVVDDAGNEISSVIQMQRTQEWHKRIRVKADISWELAPQNTEAGRGIVYRIIGDDSGTFYDGRADFSIAPTTGTATTQDVYLTNLIRRPANRIYEVTLRATDGSALLRLVIESPAA